MWKFYTIYKATCCITGLSYIGFDSNWPNRKNKHKFQYNNTKYSKKHQHFYNAICKYGWDTFTWEILYQGLDGKYMLIDREPYFIQLHDSYNNGYNLTKGGDGASGYKLSEKELERRKNDWLGNKNPNFNGKHTSTIEWKTEHSKKVSKENHPLWHIKRSPQTCQKISLARTGNIQNMYYWKMINPNGDNFIIQNLAAFCRNNNLSDAKLITVAKGKRPHHKGWKCKKLGKFLPQD